MYNYVIYHDPIFLDLDPSRPPSPKPQDHEGLNLHPRTKTDPIPRTQTGPKILESLL